MATTAHTSTTNSNPGLDGCACYMHVWDTSTRESWQDEGQTIFRFDYSNGSHAEHFEVPCVYTNGRYSLRLLHGLQDQRGLVEPGNPGTGTQQEIDHLIPGHSGKMSTLNRITAIPAYMRGASVEQIIDRIERGELPSHPVLAGVSINEDIKEMEAFFGEWRNLDWEAWLDNIPPVLSEASDPVTEFADAQEARRTE